MTVMLILPAFKHLVILQSLGGEHHPLLAVGSTLVCVKHPGGDDWRGLFVCVFKWNMTAGQHF